MTGPKKPGRSSPEHAVALADAHDGAIDAVITDVLMPQMTGLTLAEHLLARRSTMRVLYVSGFARDQQPGLASLPPGYAYLPKPFTRDSLTTTLRELFEADDRTSTGVA